MHYILYLSLPGFYVARHRIRDPSVAGIPISVHRDGAVLDANGEAVAQGIRAGMRLTEAKSVCRECVFFEFEREDYLDLQARWLDACAAHSDRIEPDDIHSAFVDLSDHPDPDSIASSLLREVERVSGISPKFGTAQSKWIARLASITGDPEGMARGDPQRYLAHLPVDLLDPVPTEMRRRLSFLGYRRIGDVAGLPISLLRSQFGGHARAIAQSSRGKGFEPVLATWPPNSIRTSFHFDKEADSAEALGNGIALLALRLGAQLEARDAQSRTVEVVFTSCEGCRDVMRHTFVRPVRDARSAAVSLRILSEKAKLRSVESIAVTLHALERAESRQLCIGRLGVAPESVDSPAIRSVRAAFGDDAIRVASQIELPRRKKVLRAWKEAVGWS